MKTRLLFLTFLFLAAFNFKGTAQKQEHTPNPSQEGNSTINKDAQESLSNVDKQFFIENKGQWNSDVLYLTKIGGLDAWITKKGVNYTFYQLEEVKQEESTKLEVTMPDKFEQKDYNIIGYRVLMNLIGNNLNVSPEGKQKQEGYYNYLIGNDPSKHASNVGLYEEALVKDVYTGIDMRYYFDKGSLRYDYIVHPGADPNQILFSFEGSDKTYLNEKGELVFTTRFGKIKNADLYCYQLQDKKQVAAKFTKKNNNWTIALDIYNKNQTLIIDPLIYSTYIGGSGEEVGVSIAVDASGNAYIYGETQSTNYDITTGAFQTTNAGGFNDVFVTKLNATGTAIVYSTYIGGTGDDIPSKIALDAASNAYITGSTKSINFPITSGAFQTVKGGSISDGDAFVTKLNTAGTALIYSTYLGGSGGDDGAGSIALDDSGNAYIAGGTASINFPITSGAFQTILKGGGDVFVTKLNATGTAIVYSTYIGGSGGDGASSITLDASGNTYITGSTTSTDFYITSGAFQTTHGGGSNDAFVTKLNATGTALIYSTYIGGNDKEYTTSIVIDTLGNSYITGYTLSFNYPTTLGAFQTIRDGARDIFITKFNATGTTLIYSTFIGGNYDDYGEDIVLDSFGNAYITGTTWSSTYDVTPGAFSTSNLFGGASSIVSKLNATGSSLLYSTFIGEFGTDNSYGTSIVLDASNNAYFTGMTNNMYPITSGAFQTMNGGNFDVFVSKLCMFVPSTINLSSTPSSTNQTLCINSAITNITYTTTGDSTTSFVGLPTGVTGNWSANSITISGTPTTSGTFNYTVNLGCESATGTITVLFPSGTDFKLACDSLFWIDGNTYYTSTNSPTYILSGGSANGCDSLVTLNLTIHTIDTTITQNGDTLFASETGATYQWLDCNNGNAIISGETNQSYNPVLSGDYMVIVSKNGCTDTTACINVILTGISELENSFVKIYPNPTGSLLNVVFNQNELFQLKIVAIDGKIIEAKTVVGNTTIDVSKYPSGMYFITATNQAGKIYQNKFIKE